MVVTVAVEVISFSGETGTCGPCYTCGIIKMYWQKTGKKEVTITEPAEMVRTLSWKFHLAPLQGMRKPAKKRLKYYMTAKKGFGCPVEKVDWVIPTLKPQPTRLRNMRNPAYPARKVGKCWN